MQEWRGSTAARLRVRLASNEGWFRVDWGGIWVGFGWGSGLG